jgi:hypothetical protein
MLRASDIDGISGDLHQLKLEASNIERTASAAKEDAIPIDKLQKIMAQLLNLAVDSRNMAREQAPLASLNFDARPVRHESIPPAHKKTFK